MPLLYFAEKGWWVLKPTQLFTKNTWIMKYTILMVLVIVAFAFSGCEQPIDYDKERAAIIAVINQETDAYLARDFDAVVATHVQDSLNMRLTAGPDNYVWLQGWEEVGKHLMGDETEDDLNPELHITVEKYNYRMKIYPNSAFVVCDQTWTSQYGEDVNEMNSIQVRFMEKIDNEWKISFVSWIGTNGYMEMEETEELFD
jgi:hypothetical protein